MKGAAWDELGFVSADGGTSGVHPAERARVPKVSVYLPEELYRRARERGLKLSALTQAALEEALREDANGPWIDAQRRRPRRTVLDFETSEVLDEVRVEFGA
jgi:post-segregation antitoxin (ccd killing protein)